jgi:hypothetical protein
MAASSIETVEALRMTAALRPLLIAAPRLLSIVFCVLVFGMMWQKERIIGHTFAGLIHSNVRYKTKSNSKFSTQFQQ